MAKRRNVYHGSDYRLCVVCDRPLEPGHKCPSRVISAKEAAHRREEWPEYVPSEGERLAEGFRLLALDA